MMIGDEEEDEELRDLTQEDAEELKRFQEKRRWFERKLKLLEEIPAIYPFILPLLTSSPTDPDGFVYANVEQSGYRLPSKQTLKSWQTERDDLEEEVLAFDGGDLGRMKEKTREVTLVPLTKSATHAVAITLDLILLIDRLLTLLRRRYDLLELVGLRLEWDSSRWKVMHECERLKVDVQAYVDSEGRWRASSKTEPSVELTTPARHQNGSSMELSTTSISSFAVENGTNSASPITTPIRPRVSSSKPHTPTSPTNLFSLQPLGTPKAKSIPMALSSRHRALVSTHLKRSSGILDKMIDIAGPLSDLGGLHGPLPSRPEDQGKNGDGGGGALPDELLDMQDDLEAACVDVKGRIDWCKELEFQRESAERYYSALLLTRDTSDKVIAHLKQSLAMPASSAQHQTLAALLREAELALPSPIDKTFPRPRHPDYPAVERYTTDTISALGQERNVAKWQCGISGDGVGWYDRLAKARSRLEEEDNALGAMTEGLEKSIAQLDRTSADGLDEVEEEWLRSAREWISTLSSRMPNITRQAQSSQMAGMKYRSSFDPPSSLRQILGEVGFPDDLHDAADRRAEGALKLVRRAEVVIREAQADIEILPVKRRVGKAFDELEAELGSLREGIEAGMVEACWRVEEGPKIQADKRGVNATREELRKCGRLFELFREGQAELAAVRQKVGVTVEREQLARLGEKTVELERGMGEARRGWDLLERVEKQRTVVETLQKEAESLLERLEVPLSDESEWAKSKVEVESWVGALAGRVKFVSSTSITLDGLSEQETTSLVQYNTTDDSPIGASVNLVKLDQSVRLHINNLSTRVSSALVNKIDHLPEIPDEPTDPRSSDVNLDNISPDPSLPLIPDEEDVFGSHNPRVRLSSSASTVRYPKSPDSRLSQIRQLRKRIKSLHLQDLVFPQSSTLLIQRLPSVQDVERISRDLTEIEGSAGGLIRSEDNEELAGKERDRLRDELRSAKAFFPRLEALAAFSSKSKVCDEVLGRLMEMVDTSEDRQDSLIINQGVDERILEGKEAVREAEECAAAVENDQRVGSDLKRIRAMWIDISSHLNTLQTRNGHDQQTKDSDSISVTSSETPSKRSISVSSPYRSRIPIPIPTPLKPRLASSLSARSEINTNLTTSGMRATSNPFPRIAGNTPRLAGTTENYRHRTASTSGDATRRRLDSPSMTNLRSVNAPSRSSTPTGKTTPSGLGENGKSRIPRLVSTSALDTGRLRKSSMPTRLGPKTGLQEKNGELAVSKRKLSGEKVYEPDSKTTLDQAVGKIVNKLQMSVPIVPVNIAGTDEWKDQSGRYWIGTEGRAKLCLCRVLRSRTVMVRIGGGWCELSRFLMDHFADALMPTSAAIDEGAMRGGLVSGVPITPHKNGSIPREWPMTGTRHGALDSTQEISSDPNVDSTSLPNHHVPTDTLQADSPENTITPASRRASIASHHLSSHNDSPTTPIRKPNLPRSLSGNPSSFPRLPRSNSGTVPLSRSSSFYSPLQSPKTPHIGTADGAANGPTSPLVPLHFLKKASESPPVREREKQRIGVGRRSILGKEGS